MNLQNCRQSAQKLPNIKLDPDSLAGVGLPEHQHETTDGLPGPFGILGQSKVFNPREHLSKHKQTKQLTAGQRQSPGPNANQTV